MTTGITCTMAMVVLSAIMLVMPSAMAVEVAAPDALSAARDISEQTIYPGSTFAVTVTLSANEDVSAPVLDEDLPDSWTVTENNSAGAWYKEVTSEWFWLGAMSSGDSKTVVYDVTVPADAELQEYAITGAASAYGVDPIDVGGESTVTVIKELSATRDISEQTIFPGSTIRVTVTLTANEEVYAPALNEDIPDGWTIAEVDSAGAYYNEATSEWFWLDTMSSGDSKIVVYDVTVPASAVPQEYAITGAVSAYEVDLIDVRGEETVTVVKELSATRDISEQTAEPGSTFTVTVTLTANEEVYAPALNEDIPDGWTVTENNSAGAYYKESTSEWFWLGGMSSGDSKTVVYDVTVPVDAGPQEYVITGAVSAYDTDLIDVRGEETVTVVATGGGCYGSDGGSDDSDAAGSVPPGSEMSVTRDISSQRVGPGSSFTVTLTILANAAVDVVAPTLTENVSIGTIVVDPDSTLDLDDVSNGTLDVSDTWYNDSATMWILPERIPAGGSLTVEYSVTVPDDATPQEYSITGSASAYDVAAVEIGGDGEVCVSLRGDFNDNGAIDIGDVAKITDKHLCNLPTTPDDLWYGDFNGNGVIDIGDVAKLANYELGNINEL